MRRGHGRLITLEGPEGSGKTTLLRTLATRLRRAGRRVVVTQEPGGTSLGLELRRAILAVRRGRPSGRPTVTPLAELLMYEADRAQHVAEVIRPALARGEVALCDRYADASVVYQGIARGLGAATVKKLNRLATGGLTPDLTVVVDVPVREGLRRVGRRGRANRLDRESRSFHEKVRRGYLALARREPGRVKVVDGAREPRAVMEQAWREVVHVLAYSVRGRL